MRSKSASPVLGRQPHLSSPPLPRLARGGGGSSPNLRTVDPREHQTRLDVAKEKLDKHVEQKLDKFLLAFNIQRQALEDWVEQKVHSSEEKLGAAVTTVQQTRSVLDSAVNSLSASGKPGGKAELDSRLSMAKLIALQERFEASDLVKAEMQARLQSFEQRLSSNLRQQFDPVRMTLLEESVTAIKAKLPSLEAATGDVLRSLSELAAMEAATGDLLRSLSDRSASKDAQEEIWTAQYSRLQSAVSGMAVRLEGFSETKHSDAQKAAVEERFAAMQAQLSSSSASYSDLEVALAAVAQRQSGDQTAERHLKDRVVALEATSAGLHVILDNKAVALEAKLLRNDIRCEASENKLKDNKGRLETSGKTAVEVQHLKLRQESFATNLEQMARRMEELLEQRGAMEEQLRAAADSVLDVKSKSTNQLAELRSKIEDQSQGTTRADTAASDSAHVQDLESKLNEHMQITAASAQELRSSMEEQLQATAASVEDMRSKFEEQLQAAAASIKDLSNKPTEQIAELHSKVEGADQSASGSGEAFRGKVSPIVGAGLVDFFVEGHKPLADAHEQHSLPARLQALEEAVQGCVSRSELLQLQARVDGDSDPIAAPMDADAAEERGLAADKLVQAFTGMENRIKKLEHRLPKSGGVLDKFMGKAHTIDKNNKVPCQCKQCGNTLAADVDFCNKCGTKKTGKHLLGAKRAIRAAQDHNFTVLKVSFDLWARGSNANCLRFAGPKNISGPGDTPSTSTPSPASGGELSAFMFPEYPSLAALDPRSPLSAHRKARDHLDPSGSRSSQMPPKSLSPSGSARPSGSGSIFS